VGKGKPLTTPVSYKRELVFCAPAERGISVDIRDLDAFLGPDGEVDEAKALAEMPDRAWGWMVQERLEATVLLKGRTFFLTTVDPISKQLEPVSTSGTTFVDGELLDIEVVRQVVKDQEAHKQRHWKGKKARGPLPHGADQSAILNAMERGDQVVVTRTGNRRTFDPTRDRVIETEPS
jgi:hypothetical protein